jgi:hypothetical protein
METVPKLTQIEQLLDKNKKKGSWKIFGCGGCGANIVKKFLDTKTSNSSCIIDTSNSNNVSGVEFHRISGLNGSGKFRAENATAISQAISSFVSSGPFEEINIVIFSLAGGSGSVIGPLLLKEIFRQKKIGIALTVESSISNIDAKNSINTLKTLEILTKDIYLPITLFSNGFGRDKVDTSVVNYINILTDLFDSDIKELDLMDKKNFFQPNRLLKSISPGLKMLNVSKEMGNWDVACIQEDDPPVKIDSTLVVSDPATPATIELSSHIIYEGFIENQYPIVMTIGYPVPVSLISHLNDTIHSFDVSQETQMINLEHDDVEITDSGLVL